MKLSPEFIEANPWSCAGFVFVVQFAWLWLRTVNVKACANLERWPHLLSGAGIGVLWLLSIGIGAGALIGGAWPPIVAHVLGGMAGAVLSLERQIVKAKKDNRHE